jgi:hypothetical protein
MNTILLPQIGRYFPVFVIALGCVATSSIGAAEAGQTKLAVFDFMLEDGSAGASIADDSNADDVSMKAVNAEVRRTIQESGRYQLIDVGKANAPSVRECNNCEAELAVALGAEQFLTGIVRRITRTEYVVSFQLRDAKTGEKAICGWVLTIPGAAARPA